MNNIKDKIIRSRDIFDTEYKRLQNMIYFGNKFPDQIFKKQFTEYLFFDYVDLLNKNFVYFLKRLINELDDEFATWITLYPDPIEYLFKNFNHYGSIRIDKNMSSEEYFNFLNYTEDNNMAEAIIHRPIDTAIFPSNPEWCIYADTWYEMGVIALPSSKIKSVAISNSFKTKLLPISEAVKQSIGHGFSSRRISKEFKEDLINNYSTAR